MGSQAKPFRNIRISSCCTGFFGVLSVLVGISEMCIWLSQVGLFGIVQGSENRRNRIRESYGGLSGAGMAFVVACGLWCGIWIALTGICGCCIQENRQSDKNNRTRIVVCIASALNAIIFCPIQIALYAWVFKPEEPWIVALNMQEPVLWMIIFQSAGIATGVASFIICIVNVVIAARTKYYHYTGQTKTWEEFDV